MQPNRYPATDFLCDLIRMRQGQMTKDQIRAKWKAGEYPGVNPVWAGECMKYG